MQYIDRLLKKQIENIFSRGKSILLWGARQTGKTTLLEHLDIDYRFSFIKPDVRLLYEKNPELLEQQIKARVQKASIKRKPIIALDEVQRVPVIMDVVQDLIDNNIANFILTGSSARKLKNLLPGRVITTKLDPLTYKEIRKFEEPELDKLLLYGSLPGIYTLKNTDYQDADLESYATTYLEEEIRRESLARDIDRFSAFLELAAYESGNIVNFSKISKQIGVSHSTIQNYYQIAQDCLVIERLEPLSNSKTRSKLTKSPKLLFFDLGLRRLCAKEGPKLPRDKMGNLFEQFITLEMLRNIRLSGKRQVGLHFWRDPDGPEVDLVLVKEDVYTPIEVKLTNSPTIGDCRHLKVFMSEYPNCSKAYIICTAKEPLLLDKNIMAIPWQNLATLL